MIGNYSWFLSFTKIKNDGEVLFGDNSKGKIIGIGNIGKYSFTFIENVCLKYDLLNISQLFDKSYKVVFDKIICVIESPCDDKVLFIGKNVLIYTPLI